MALSVKFSLKNPQGYSAKGFVPKPKISDVKESPVIAYMSFGYSIMTPDGKRKYRELRYHTGEKIHPKFWNFEKGKAKQLSEFDHQNFNTILEGIENLAKQVYREMTIKGIRVTPEALKNEIDIISGRAENLHREFDFLEDYIDDFIKKTESGERLSDKRKRYVDGSIKNFKGFLAQLKEFQEFKRRKVRFDDITIDFYDQFVQFFNEKKYSPNTIGRHIKNLKIFMRHSRDEGFHNNNEFERKKFKAPQVDVANVYLTEEELDKIFELDLSEDLLLDVSRDVFLIGCYSGQRFSDYSRINKSMVEKFGGTEFIKLTQVKTGIEVTIPISDRMKSLLEKYDWKVPKIYEQKLNDRIKKVAKKAKIKDVVNIEEIRGGVKISKKDKKYNLIKTHTARRTACTNMYLAGIPTIAIMKISGHKTEREFLKYIKVSNDESALTLANHPYFKNKLKVV